MGTIAVQLSNFINHNGISYTEEERRDLDQRESQQVPSHYGFDKYKIYTP